jgi:hypothetical protein
VGVVVVEDSLGEHAHKKHLHFSDKKKILFIDSNKG